MPAMSRCRYTSWAEPRRARYQPSRSNLRLIGPVLVSTNAATRWTTNSNRHRRAPAGTGLGFGRPTAPLTASLHGQRYYGDSSGVTQAGSRRTGWPGRVVVSCTGYPTRDHVRARLIARPAGEHVGPGWRVQQLDIFARRRRRSPVPREHGDGPGGESSGDRATGEGVLFHGFGAAESTCGIGVLVGGAVYPPRDSARPWGPSGPRWTVAPFRPALVLTA